MDDPFVTPHLRASLDQRRARLADHLGDWIAQAALTPAGGANFYAGVAGYTEDLGALLSEVMAASPDLCDGALCVIGVVLDHAATWTELLDPIRPND